MQVDPTVDRTRRTLPPPACIRGISIPRFRYRSTPGKSPRPPAGAINNAFRFFAVCPRMPRRKEGKPSLPLGGILPVVSPLSPRWNGPRARHVARPRRGRTTDAPPTRTTGTKVHPRAKSDSPRGPASCKVAAQLFCPRVAASRREP